MQPGDTVSKIVHVHDSAGTAVTGLVLASFTVTAYKDGVAFTHNSTITEIGSGDYLWQHTQPSPRCHAYVRIRPTNAAYRCSGSSPRSLAFEGEGENQDLDSVYAACVRPVITLTSQGTIGQTVAVDVHKFRYTVIEIECVDSAGAPIDMSTAYTNYRLAVKSEDQTTTVYTGSGATITGSSGLLTITIPEDAGYNSALAAGVASIGLYWDVVGDLGGTASKTVPVVPSSPFTLHRSEAAA